MHAEEKEITWRKKEAEADNEDLEGRAVGSPCAGGDRELLHAVQLRTATCGVNAAFGDWFTWRIGASLWGTWAGKFLTDDLFKSRHICTLVYSRVPKKRYVIKTCVL